jgi:hypothetical protein
MGEGSAIVNRPLLGRIAPFLFGFYATGLLAFVAYAGFTFPPSLFLPTLRWEYALKRGFVLFMDYIVPLHAAAIAVAASLTGFARTPRVIGAPARPFNKVVSSAVVTFLVLAAGYTVLFEGVYPGVRRRLSDMQYESRLAREFLSQADAARSRADYRASLDDIDRYLAIDPNNKRVEAERLLVKGLAARRAAPSPERAPAGQTAATETMSAQALVEMAHYYFDRQDWFSAHYYAQAAYSLDPRRTDALALAAQARKQLDGFTESPKDAQTAALFKQKKDAYNLLAGGNPLAAYYRFVELAKKNPGDQDIARYLAEAGTKVAESAFFLEDAKKYEPLPGVQKILFLNGRQADAGEAVYIGKMIELPMGDAYFYDIEAIRYDASGAVAWHFTAPYGRSEGASILMRCIDRTDARVQFLPLYRQGSRPTAERTVLMLRPTMAELRSLSTSRDALAAMGLAEVWRMRGTLGGFGMSRQSLTVDMTMKILMPFVFLIISLFALALGWAFRARFPGRPSAFAVILVPLVPIVLAVLTLLYVHAHRVIIGFTVLAFGFAAAMVVLGILQTALLAVALVMLAGQSTR